MFGIEGYTTAIFSNFQKINHSYWGWTFSFFSEKIKLAEISGKKSVTAFLIGLG
jgi:hypothetical protein